MSSDSSGAMRPILSFFPAWLSPVHFAAFAIGGRADGDVWRSQHKVSVLGWRPLVCTSKELGRVLRAGGLTINHDPGTQTVIAYRRWLKANAFSAEQVRQVLVDHV